MDLCLGEARPGKARPCLALPPFDYHDHAQKLILMLMLMLAGGGRVLPFEWNLEPADGSDGGGVHGNTRRAPEVYYARTMYLIWYTLYLRLYS